jgi:dTDP-4-amino-4,6-dideoxy-D-galactose acyltransferase
MWQALPWDSQFFGLRVARLTVDAGGLQVDALTAALAELHTWRADLVYALLESTDIAGIAAAEAAGMRLVDIRVTLECALAPQNVSSPLPAGFQLETFTLRQLPALRNLAARSFSDTRFYRDTRFPRERADALYATWIERSCTSSDETVLVCEHGDGLGGFITYKANQATGTAQIGLIAVDAAAQGLGIGTALVRAAQAQCAEAALTRLSVVTQGSNLAAQRLYQRCGFLSSSLQLWFHHWLAPEEGQ